MPLKVGVLVLITAVTVNQVRKRVVMTDLFIPFFNATIYLGPSVTGAIPLKGNCKLVLVSVEWMHFFVKEKNSLLELYLDSTQGTIRDKRTNPMTYVYMFCLTYFYLLYLLVYMNLIGEGGFSKCYPSFQEWYHSCVKGCFFLEDDGTVSSLQYQLHIPQTTTVFLSIQPLSLSHRPGTSHCFIILLDFKQSNSWLWQITRWTLSNRVEMK